MGGVSTYTYVFVRKDLSPVTRIVQVAHAAFEMGRDLGRPTEETLDNLVVLEVADSKELLKIGEFLEYNKIRHHMFYEPDYDLGYTAVCSEPVKSDKKKLFNKFKLLN